MRLIQTRGKGQDDLETEIGALLARSVVPADGSVQITNGHFTDAGDIKIAAEIQFLLDQISSTRGTLLYRGASAWAALVPGTSGDVLTTNGAGADPTWVAPSSGGGGALTLITETVTSGSAANVSFTPIANTYRDLEVRVRARGTVSATFSEIRMLFNNDTGNNYDYFEAFTNTAPPTWSGGSAYAQPFMRLGYVAGATSTAAVSDLIMAHIGNYRGTTFQKAVISTGTLKVSTSGNSIYNVTENNWWRSTSAITRIDVFPVSGGFVDNSVISLYGRM